MDSQRLPDRREVATLGRVKTDAQCKLLARLRPKDLLALIGDADAQHLSTSSVELREIKRTVDVVFKLRRGRTYYHHVEFQAKPDRTMNRRCFLYNALLLDQYQAPVMTTIVYLFPQKKPIEPVFRVELGGREINRWQFGCVHLWEIEAQAALRRGLPGMAALVPLMKGAQWSSIEQAVRQIETKAPARHQNDLLAILHAFAEARYTTERLDQLIGRRRLMESSIYRRGRTQGRAEGQLITARELCRAAVHKWHPRANSRVLKAIEKCTDLAVLKKVALNASEWDTRDILRRLTKH
jgi:predicted transposase YdaD